MKHKQITEKQTVGILKAHEASGEIPDLSRRYGVSEQSIYCKKVKYCGMEVSEAKGLLAEAMLDNAALNEFIRGKW